MPESPNLEKAALAWSIPWDSDWVTAVTFIGGSRRLAAGNNLGQIFLWELPEKKDEPLPAPLRRLDGHKNAITALVATPDGKKLISASYDHTVRVWDLEATASGTEQAVLDPKARQEAARRAGKKEADATGVKVEVQPAARVIEVHQEWVRGLALSQDGTRLLTGDDRGLAILWEVAEMKEVRRLQAQGWLIGVALSADAALAATCEYAPRYATFKNAARVWDLATGQVKLDLAKEFPGQYGGVLGLGPAAFSPDGKLLAVGKAGEVDGNAKVYLLDLATGKKLREMNGHQYGVTGLAFHPAGEMLASCGRDTLLRLWQAADGKQAKELGKARGGQFKDWIHAVSFSADGLWVAAADMAGAIYVWSL